MINETNQLAHALKHAGIAAAPWHPRYGPISNIKANAPCIQIILDGSRVSKLVSVASEKGKNIRRFGDNQGSFPAMNLTPLYRITNAETKKAISALIESRGEGIDLETIKSWCVTDNWGAKFQKKYRQNFTARPAELLKLLGEANGFEPINDLIHAAEAFQSPELLHQEMERVSFQMLRDRNGIVSALQILFYMPTQKDEDNGETGKLSVVLDSEELLDEGWSTAGPKFAKGLNAALMRAEALGQGKTQYDRKDAFGLPYAPIEDTMPKVKLDAGFDVTLRTMFHGQPCQYRYGAIENGSYPISREKRTELSAALEWLSREERQDKTWVRLGKDEAMFVYPSKLPDGEISLTGSFQKPSNERPRAGLFEAKAQDFAEYLTKTKALDPERYPEWMQFFALRKLDKARTKVVYSYNTTPDDIVARSDQWQRAAVNLPRFHFGVPWVPFPLRVSAVINRVWKRDGSVIDDQHKDVPAYHGMELFFGVPQEVLREDLRILMRNASPLAPYAGKLLIGARRQNDQVIHELQSVLALLGMLLYWMDHRKDDYMNEYPYLLGQMLKAADSLHELYCVNVRGDKDDQLPQLIGGSFYAAAADFPNQTLAQLLKRMQPYLNWARSNKSKRLKAATDNGEPPAGPSAGYYLSVFSQLAGQLKPVLAPDVRFSDVEKAQLFIGYLASFPKKESPQPQQSEESSNESNSVKGE